MNKLTITNEIFATWASDPKGPVALHLKQRLISVEGNNAVVFPPTYPINDRNAYNIDPLADGTKVATIDSVGSQANRMEPIFKSPEYTSLVPQIEFNYAGGRTVSIFDVGHRIGDALVRCSTIADQVVKAFADFQNNNDATAIAKLAPTSLVFGVWDSRGSAAKLPRIVQSIIRAWDVSELTRSAQYNTPIDYFATAVFSEDDKAKDVGDPKSDVAKRGFVDVPSTGAHGGVVARGGIIRDVTINLIALRRLQSAKANTESGGIKDTDGAHLRQYILGLALVTGAEPLDGFLRQGCQLTPDPGTPSDWELVNRDGSRTAVNLTTEVALALARAASEQFGVLQPVGPAQFLAEKAKSDIAKNKEDKKVAAAAKKAASQAKKAANETNATDESNAA